MIIAAMLVCIAAPVVVILEELTRAPDGTKTWSGTYFLAFAFLASLEGILSERALMKRRITGWQYVGSRAAEALILLLLLKLANYIPLGWDALLADAQLWVANPFEFIAVRDFFIGALFLPLWLGSLHIGRMVRELDVEERVDSAPPDKTSPEYYLWLTQPPVAHERQERLSWLTEMVLWGGMAILLVSVTLYLLAPTAGLPAVATVLYFALGVALLSQARFSVTYAGWQMEGTTIQRGMGRRWLLWAALFLATVALVALLLPTYYTLGPLRALMGVLSMIYLALSFVIGLIIFLVTLPLALLNPGAETPEPPEVDPMLIPAAEAVVGGGTPPWLEILASAVFWLVVLGIVLYALRRFLQDRLGGVDEREMEGSWWGRLLAWLRDLWRRWWTWQEGVQDRLARRRVRGDGEGPITARLSRFFFPGRLPPRELVRYFYLSAARRAAEVGQPRGPGQTPSEYRAALDHRFPELEPDLEGLTAAFIEARYGNRPLQTEDAEAVRPLWQRVKAALRRRRVQPSE
jgi:hypothetical protein